MAFQVLLKRFNVLKTRFLAALDFPYHADGIDPAMILMDVQANRAHEPSLNPTKSILRDIIGNGFTWAVQTHRRSIERRLSRKLAVNKRIKIKTNLMMCNICGHFNEGQTICGNCYQKVREETEQMKEAIQNEWKLEAVDKEVVVLYDNDKKHDNKEFWKGKRIVEIKKERPDWFQYNLTVKTRNEDASAEKNVQINTKSIISHVK